METILIVVFIFILLGSLIIDKYYDKRFKETLKKQNERIIFVNYNEINVAKECFKDKNFFKLINSGKNPCEVEDINYIKYSNKDDLFLANKGS